MGIKIPGTFHSAGPQENPGREVGARTARERQPATQSRSIPLELDIRETLASLEKLITRFNRRFEFSVDQSINRIIVKVIDRETDKVIKEIPPQEIQHLLASLREMMGLLVDEEI